MPNEKAMTQTTSPIRWWCLKAPGQEKKGGASRGVSVKRTSLAEPAQIASKRLSITSAFLPPASMESKGNGMVGSSEEELFMLSDESLAVCGGLRENWRGECAARVLDSPLTGKSFAPNVLLLEVDGDWWTGRENVLRRISDARSPCPLSYSLLTTRSHEHDPTAHALTH